MLCFEAYNNFEVRSRKPATQLHRSQSLKGSVLNENFDLNAPTHTLLKDTTRFRTNIQNGTFSYFQFLFSLFKAILIILSTLTGKNSWKHKNETKNKNEIKISTAMP